MDGSEAPFLLGLAGPNHQKEELDRPGVCRDASRYVAEVLVHYPVSGLCGGCGGEDDHDGMSEVESHDCGNQAALFAPKCLECIFPKNRPSNPR